MRVKSDIKAGGRDENHNQSVKGLRVRSGVKAGIVGSLEGPLVGGGSGNHNQSLQVVRVRRDVKAGRAVGSSTGQRC